MGSDRPPDESPYSVSSFFGWLTGSLAARILIGMLAITLLPLLFVALVGYNRATQAILESVRSESLSIAMGRKALLEQWLEERRRDLSVLAADAAVIRATRTLLGESDPDLIKELSARLEGFSRQAAAYESIVIYDLAWEEIAGTSSDHRHTIPEFDLSNIRSLVSGREGVSVSRAHSHHDGGVGIHVGAPLYDSSGEGLGYILSSLDFSQTLDRILQDRTGLGSTGKSYVVDSEGIILTEPHGNKHPVATTRLEGPVLARLIEGESGSEIYLDYRGVRVIGGYTPVTDLGWGLLAERDVAEALSWKMALAKSIASAAVFTALLIVGIALWMSNRLSEPMRTLLGVANRIRGGDHAARVPELSGTEARNVGRALNAMLDELHQAQGRLAHAKALSAIGELSSSVVHEMRNPLSSIKMNLQGLAAYAARDADHAELAKIASEQVDRIERMLSELLGYGKPLEVTLGICDVRELVRNASDSVAAEASKKSVEIECEAKAGGVMIEADADRISQAISNLLLNAIHESPAGTKVHVRTSRDDGPPASAIIEVMDEGAGLTEENVDRLFLPFFTTKDEGTGLGLANVKKIVDYHGGEVEAENRQEGGAVFRIVLPALESRP